LPRRFLGESPFERAMEPSSRKESAYVKLVMRIP
jgi:hypothetical protein